MRLIYTYYCRPGDHINRQQNTGLVLWDACYLLGRLIESLEARTPNYVKSKRCLDLGAGTGLLSIVAWLLGAETVVATDIGDAVELLASNITSNVDRIAAGRDGGHAASKPPVTAELWWGEGFAAEAGEGERAELNQPFDLVFCSEVIYNADGHGPLLKCLAAVTRPGSVILMSYKFRGLDESSFVDSFKKNKEYKVREIPKGMLDPEFVHETEIKVLRAVRL